MCGLDNYRRKKIVLGREPKATNFTVPYHGV
jgi:hypothetical protein